MVCFQGILRVPLFNLPSSSSPKFVSGLGILVVGGLFVLSDPTLSKKKKERKEKEAPSAQ